MSSTYVYRVLKSTWGIRVSVTASSAVVSLVDGLSLGAQEGVAVSFSESAAELSDTLKGEIREGLALVESDILAACCGKSVSIAVEKVAFNETDFQVEGLSVAMIRWAEQEFGLPAHEVEVSFDRYINRYSFRFI
jgi:hypothetical protein